MGMLPEWEIERDEFLERLGCGARDFEKKLCLPKFKKIQHILPLRNLKNAESVVPISSEMLFYLVSRLTTLDKQYPFKNSAIQFCKVDPNYLKIGQKFVYRENYQNLLEGLPNLLGKFAIASGIGDLGAYFIFGMDEAETPSLACYLPPIIENHGSDLVIMDGIHRDYITKQLGCTINAILIKNVAIPFPCGIKSWEEIKVIGLAEKPKDINERYFNLQKELFRDLKYLGIDG